MKGPANRRQLLALFAALGLPAAAPAADPVKKTVSIEINKFDDPQEGVVWLAYAVALANWATSSGALDKAPPGVLVPSFEGELTARRTLIVIWREMLEKQPRTLPYMDELMRIEAAGFMPEYVWTVHWRSSWKQQPPDLRIAEFYAWQRKELVGHEPRTGSRVRVVAASAPESPASAASR